MLGSDHDRFEQLNRDHAGRVKAYALRRVGSATAADEVVSDVFLVVWRRLDDIAAFTHESREAQHAQWKKAVERLLVWAD